MRIKHLWAGLLVAGLVLSTAYWLLTRSWPVSPLTAEEKKMTDTLFAQTKPQCAGRYLFEVPVSFHNVLAGQVWINDMRITSKRLYRPAFEQRIHLREQELNNSHTVNPRDQPFLKQVYRLSDTMVIFDRNENGSVPGFGRILEGHLYSNGVAFTVTTTIRDLTDIKYLKYKEYYLGSGMKESRLNNKVQKLAEIQSLLSRLAGRADEEVPNKPGLCISDGFIIDDNSRWQEKITLRYDLDGFNFAVSSNNRSKKGENLLTWGKRDIEPTLLRIRAVTLQKGKVELQGIDAEEWLVKGRQEVKDKNVDAYRFIFYANERLSDYKHPKLSVNLHNSGLETKNYTDSQLVEIWDRITRTFRYRPGAF